MEKYTREDITTAYLKLKHFVYYDTNLLFLRDRLAKFESSESFESELDELVSTLNHATTKNKEKLQGWYDQIDFHILPKSFKEKQFKIDGTLISNKSLTKENKVTKVSYFIDCPIQLHLIGILWLIKVGYKLEENIESCNYGYRLAIDEDSNRIKNGLSLYKPYFILYKNWRDNAIKKAKALIEEDKNVAIVGLDIKSFFHSVDIDFQKLKQDLGSSEYHRVTTLVKNICHIYTSKVHDFSGMEDSSQKALLPIGFLASGVIANWHLKTLDRNILDNLNPIYYGRYVDDMVLVIQNPKIQYSDDKPISGFINKYFVKTGILEFADNKEDFNISGYNNLTIQPKKISLGDFDGKGSKAVLDKFEKNLIKTSSEFNFLPQDDIADTELDEEVHTLNYSDSVNKLSSLKDLHINKYAASKFIAKKIFKSTISPKKPDTKTGDQIISIFSEVLGLEFYILWEKITTFFIVNGLSKHFLHFVKDVRKTIGSLDFEIEGAHDQLSEKCKRDFEDYFSISYSLALGLDRHILQKRKLYDYFEFELDDLISNIRSFRQSNLIRNHYVASPALTFTKHCTSSDHSLIDYNFKKESKQNKLDEHSIKYSPRYVPFSELLVFQIQQLLIEGSELMQLDDTNKVEASTNYFHKAFDKFYQINYEYRYPESTEEVFARMILSVMSENTQTKDFKKDLRNHYFKLGDTTNIQDDIVCQEITLPSSPKKKSLKVAIANHKVNISELSSSIHGNSIITEERKANLIKLLNTAKKLKADFVVLPENSVPFEWLEFLNFYVKKNEIGVVCGLEHLNQNNVVYNYQAVILPISFAGMNDAFLSLRLKNHYSHREKMVIEDYGYKVPEPIKSRYELYKWCGVSFSTYNCFELADILHRSIFTSKVDFIVATEYNQDTEYFSNIVESATRDIHCFFIQVNSSDFGDSRITKPSKSYKKDLIRLKGGENDTVLTATINIQELRNFQLKGYKLQKEDEERFKPTPPGFNRSNVKKRMR